jgi:CHAT domain-containing protein
VNAERDYRRAMALLAKREPRIDQSVLTLGAASDRESAFDRLIRLLLRQERVAAAFDVAQQASALRISSLHAVGAGVRDVFHPSRIDAPISRAALRHTFVAQVLLSDALITWIVQDGETHVIRRDVRAREVLSAVEDLRSCAAAGSCNERALLERVSQWMLRDWIARVARDATIVIQPPAELQGVPFAILTTQDGERLFQRNGISTTPTLQAFLSATHLDAQRISREPSAYFAAAPSPEGRDPLPRATSEVTRAASFYPRTIIALRATRAQFLAEASRHTIVHFAGHVVVNNARPLFGAGVRAGWRLDRLTASGDARARRERVRFVAARRAFRV